MRPTPVATRRPSKTFMSTKQGRPRNLERKQLPKERQQSKLIKIKKMLKRKKRKTKFNKWLMMATFHNNKQTKY